MSKIIGTTWKCPYCPQVGNSTYNKAAYYGLTTHLIAEHLDEAAAAVVENLDKAQLINSTVGWRTISSCITDTVSTSSQD